MEGASWEQSFGLKERFLFSCLTQTVMMDLTFGSLACEGRIVQESLFSL